LIIQKTQAEESTTRICRKLPARRFRHTWREDSAEFYHADPQHPRTLAVIFQIYALAWSGYDVVVLLVPAVNVQIWK